MFLRNLFMPRLFLLLMLCAPLSWPSYSQQVSSPSQAQDQAKIEGTVVASSHVTFVVRTDDNQFHLFTLDRDTNSPRTLPVGTRVRVNSDQGDQTGARHATDVTILEQARGAGTATSSARNAAPIPPPVRDVENQIQHDARRWRLGVQGGVGLNPELILFGIHSQMGPIFSRNVFFRPNADFEWGEITDMVALNLEAVYRIPTRMRSGLWAPYVGAGPSLNFIHQSFQTKAGQARNISFSNFDYETGFNILMGLQNGHGTFFEVKTSLYSEPAPVLRLILGRNF
jgi:hypothetical protein